MPKFHMTPTGVNFCYAEERECRYETIGDFSSLEEAEKSVMFNIFNSPLKKNHVSNENLVLGNKQNFDEEFFKFGDSAMMNGVKTVLNGDETWVNDSGLFHRLDGPAVLKSDGTKEWWVNGVLHCGNGPAIVKPDGSQDWIVNGKLHRNGGPAVIKNGGASREWYTHGVRHNDDGPAVIKNDGSLEWWVNGERHRDDGPAVIHGDNTKEWRIHNLLHRMDGPAVIHSNGDQEWWINGEQVETPAFNENNNVL